jgi:phage-related baseplate assembly protein|tara:strand:- start:190 stop:1992 length:1803 start_codon:yes stop_codon:yes gene_type:complete
MSKQKKTPIKYTSRDFDTIRQDLIEHAKRFYPDEWKDFSKSTINSLMIDSVAYVGDVLSFYLDYQANESFLDTAIEFNNVRKHARTLGFKYAGSPSTYGLISIFCMIPANNDGTAPDLTYMPILQQGATFSSTNGGNFILTEDVDLGDLNNDIVAARFDNTTGATTFFAVKAFGQISSGLFSRATVDLTNSSFERFKRVRIGGDDVVEVTSVVDSDGNKYYEVDNLSQEVVFEETTNRNATSEGVRSILKPFSAARRFVMEQDDTGTYLQFGFGSEDSDEEDLIDPSKVAMQMHGKTYVSNFRFDPSKLVGTSKLGLSPSGTKLTILMKTNDSNSANASSNTVNKVQLASFKFPNELTLNQAKKNSVISSLEITNEEPIVGATEQITTEELKQRAKGYYTTQSRAVTRQDYESMIYNMPNKFGIIKRVSVVNDPSSTNRRMATYVISEDQNGNLVTAGSSLKTNMKNWISQYKAMNDIVDIFDAKIVNFGIDYKVVLDTRFKAINIVGKCNSALREYFSNQLYIGEPIYITRLYSILGKVEGVADVKTVRVMQKRGADYSSVNINFDDALSADGTYIMTPKNAIMELKYPNRDIKGTLIR